MFFFTCTKILFLYILKTIYVKHFDGYFLKGNLKLMVINLSFGAFFYITQNIKNTDVELWYTLMYHTCFRVQASLKLRSGSKKRHRLLGNYQFIYGVSIEYFLAETSIFIMIIFGLEEKVLRFFPNMSQLFFAL